MAAIAELTNLVAGRHAATLDGVTSSAIDPCTGETFAQAPVTSVSDLDAAFTAAAAAFGVWRDTTPAKRSLALLRIADALEARSEELLAKEVRDTGKPPALTRQEELPPMIDYIRFYAAAARMLEGRSTAEYMRDHTSSIRREPVGVCAQVTPSNYPAMMAIWKWAPAIAAGNTVVLKPAETTPSSTLFMAEVMAEFLPPGVFNVVCGGRATGQAMVSYPVPAMVSLTGSVRAGSEVAAAAAAGLKRVHLELGGKAPVVISDDADVVRTAAGVASVGYYNAGQDCTAACRVLAAPRICDDFVSALAAAAKRTRAGRVSDEADYGPLNSADALSRVQGHLSGLGDHAEVVTGGRHVSGPGYLFEPTVITGARQQDDIIQQEVFGPVITVQRFFNGTKPSSGPTVCGTAWAPRSGPATTAGPCGCRGGWTSEWCGSTRTCGAWPRCRTAASRHRDTGKTSRFTCSRTTPASSTS
jgi:betaine-aldehyde dehydrogenase